MLFDFGDAWRCSNSLIQNIRKLPPILKLSQLPVIFGFTSRYIDRLTQIGQAMIKHRHDSAPGQSIASPRSSVDGYIRLRERDLCVVELIHVCTLRDTALLDVVAHGALSTGLTEWIGRLDGHPADISIGWDWYRDRHNRIRLAGSDIRSNLMLIGVSGSDWGMKRTERALRRWLGRHDWAQAIAKSANEFLH